MEKDQLLDMIRLYKQALADMTEEKFACQALLNMQAKQIQDLNDQIQKGVSKRLHKHGILKQTPIIGKTGVFHVCADALLQG